MVYTSLAGTWLQGSRDKQKRKASCLPIVAQQPLPHRHGLEDLAVGLEAHRGPLLPLRGSSRPDSADHHRREPPLKTSFFLARSLANNDLRLRAPSPPPFSPPDPADAAFFSPSLVRGRAARRALAFLAFSQPSSPSLEICRVFVCVRSSGLCKAAIRNS